MNFMKLKREFIKMLMSEICIGFIFMSNTTKYRDNGFYVIHDCFNKVDKDC